MTANPGPDREATDFTPNEAHASNAKDSDWKPLGLSEKDTTSELEAVERPPTQPTTAEAPSRPEGESEAVDQWEEVLQRQVSVPKTSGKKIGLLGGPGVGKSYYFHALVYRTLDDETSGAVSYYLRSSNVWVSREPGERASEVDLRKMVGLYEKWIPFLRTTLEGQAWYRLRLGFRTGWLGTNRSQLEVEFLDGSGEGFTRPLSDLTRPTWDSAFHDADIMVFCLPMWAAFPGDLSPKDERQQEQYLDEFAMVLRNYNEIRDPALKVRAILALTMADDDKRCALQTVVQRWIKPFISDPDAYLKQLRRRSGVARYLANAREISEYIHGEFAAFRGSPLVRRIPKDLDFGRGLPWIIPVTAVDGKVLESVVEARMSGDGIPRRLASPVPAHVELPLLVALCEYHNVLM